MIAIYVLVIVCLQVIIICECLAIGYHFGKKYIPIKKNKRKFFNTHLKVFNKKIPRTVDEDRLQAIKSGRKIIRSFRK